MSPLRDKPSKVLDPWIYPEVQAPHTEAYLLSHTGSPGIGKEGQD